MHACIYDINVRRNNIGKHILNMWRKRIVVEIFYFRVLLKKFVRIL